MVDSVSNLLLHTYLADPSYLTDPRHYNIRWMERLAEGRGRELGVT